MNKTAYKTVILIHNQYMRVKHTHTHRLFRLNLKVCIKEKETISRITVFLSMTVTCLSVAYLEYKTFSVQAHFLTL